jgi:hypothetical protein
VADGRSAGVVALALGGAGPGGATSHAWSSAKQAYESL